MLIGHTQLGTYNISGGNINVLEGATSLTIDYNLNTSTVGSSLNISGSGRVDVAAGVNLVIKSGGTLNVTGNGLLVWHERSLSEAVFAGTVNATITQVGDDLYFAAIPTRRFQLTITPATAPDTGFDLKWDSQQGMRYNLRSSTDLVGAIPTWDLAEGDIVATPPTNVFNVDSAGPRRFYAVEEFVAPPLLAADFEGDDGGFTQSTDAGTAWARGAPDSKGEGGVVNAGSGGSAECWGTNLGAYAGGAGDEGFYANPTTNSRLISPAIDLTLVAAAELGFAQAIDIETNDSAVVRLYHADTNDEIVSGDFPLTVNDLDISNAGWTASGPHALPVGAPIRIEWILSGTGGATQDYTGWYIDDVLVEEPAP